MKDVPTRAPWWSRKNHREKSTLPLTAAQGALLKYEYCIVERQIRKVRARAGAQVKLPEGSRDISVYGGLGVALARPRVYQVTHRAEKK